jgi:hypothetical protein
MPRDPYSILGVERDSAQTDIAAAYRRLARENHPDIHKTGDAGARMREINAAYRVLRNTDARSAYDRKHPVGPTAAQAAATGRTNTPRTWDSSPAGAATSASLFPSYRFFGGTVDRAIVGVLASLLVLILALLFAGDGVYWGASIALAVGCWVGSVPNARLSSQHGAAVGGVIGIFLAAMIGITGFSFGDGSNLAGQVACCAPFTIFMGASTGAMLGSAAGWLRKAGSFRVQSHRSEES